MEEKDVVTNVEPQEQQTENVAAEAEDVAVVEEAKDEQVSGGENEVAESVEKEAAAQEVVKEKKQKTKKEKSVKVKKEKKVKEQEPQVDVFEGLSDDEIYTKIQTEKLLRRKKNKRISTLVALCFSFALAVCLIVLSVVPVSLKPKCLYDGFSTVTMHSGTGTKFSFGEGNKQDTYDKFMELYDKSFAQPYISAIFSGSLFQYEIEELYSQNATTVLNNQLFETGEKYFQLTYDKAQTFTKQNGRKYISRVANTTFDGVLKFETAYIVVNDEEGFRETTVFVVANNYPTKSGKESHVVKVTVRSNTNEIYKSWKEIKEIYDNEGV